MHRFWIPIMLVAFFVISACAGPKAETERQKLHKELLKWESFDSQGVIEISFMGLALRKLFSAAKNQDQLRLDILEGGVMGAGAQPLMSFYVGDYVAFKSPYLPMLEMLNLSDQLPLRSMAHFSSADSLVARYGKEIISNKKLVIDQVSISFKPDYKLDFVYDPTTKMELKAIYGSGGKLSELNLKGTDNLSLKLSFDNLDYVQPLIVPLPQSAPNLINDSLKGLQDLDLKELLKQFLQNK